MTSTIRKLSAVDPYAQLMSPISYSLGSATQGMAPTDKMTLLPTAVNGIKVIPEAREPLNLGNLSQACLWDDFVLFIVVN